MIGKCKPCLHLVPEGFESLEPTHNILFSVHVVGRDSNKREHSAMSWLRNNTRHWAFQNVPKAVTSSTTHFIFPIRLLCIDLKGLNFNDGIGSVQQLYFHTRDRRAHSFGAWLIHNLELQHRRAFHMRPLSLVDQFV